MPVEIQQEWFISYHNSLLLFFSSLCPFDTFIFVSAVCCFPFLLSVSSALLALPRYCIVFTSRCASHCQFSFWNCLLLCILVEFQYLSHTTVLFHVVSIELRNEITSLQIAIWVFVQNILISSIITENFLYQPCHVLCYFVEHFLFTSGSLITKGCQN